jgi:hypothetical protein
VPGAPAPIGGLTRDELIAEVTLTFVSHACSFLAIMTRDAE